MTRRIVAITVAVVLAAIGTIGGVFLVVTADDRARDAINDAVVVAVATKRIPAGTTGARVRSDGLVRFEKMPRVSVPSDALEQLTAETDSLVITANIEAGQILMKANFGTRAAATGGLPLPEGKMAVTVQTGAPEQVAGYVRSGAQVAIFLTYTLVRSNGTRTNIEKTRLLLPRVEVLAVGTNPGSDGSSGESRNRSLMVTVAVTQPEAERLIEGLSHGTLYLALLTDSTDVKPGPGVDNTDSNDTSTSLF